MIKIILSRDRLSMSIDRGDLVGITGESGSGKVLSDILTGLIKPVTGKILSDKKEYILNMAKYQVMFLKIYSFNDTLAKNIAFGEFETNIDFKKINECMKVAQLEEFVEKNVLGIKTKIGENGLNMSGGQRQRLAIARVYIGIW